MRNRLEIIKNYLHFREKYGITIKKETLRVN